MSRLQKVWAGVTCRALFNSVLSSFPRPWRGLRDVASGVCDVCACFSYNHGMNGSCVESKECVYA
jgi:hypothetical protein